MTLDYTEGGTIKVIMIDYIDEIIAALYKVETRGSVIKTSNASEDVYKVDEDCEKLSPEKANIFHNTVAKNIYTTKRVRPDTCTAVAFFTTRVREPDKDGWGKLFRIMKYIGGKRDIPLILSANDSGSGFLKWWIDASYAEHPNIRGHTGGGMSMVRGFPIVTSTKQKLNTLSSTESVIFGVYDCMLAVCWTRYFMEAHGYQVMVNILYQDNKSAILL